MSSSQRYLITTALPYANGPIHIGHLAGVYIPADIYVRYLRATGKDVLLVGGSDEHGVPISIKAKQEGKTPQQVVDHYHEILGTSLKNIGVSFDIYSRTSSKTHHETASEYFKQLEAAGKFEVKESEQYYDEQEHQFLADRYITGTCPHCQNPEAYGDQCEKCGTSLSPNDLINPKSALSGNVPVKKSTKHWYLPLDQYEPWLKEWIVEGKKGEWKSNVYGQCKSWIDQGLQPRAVTRDLDWGVPVPVAGGEGKVLYVWFDAPIGYISATKDYFNGADDWKKYWKTEESGGDTKLIHFIGKDNIVFHCIIFPAMLKAHGEYLIPENVPANEFLNLEGDKISTSRNWAVWLHEYLEDFPGQEDALRYALTSIMPETKDADFTWSDFQARNNNELVAIFGNFINRTLVLTGKYWGGQVPQASISDTVSQAIATAKAQVSQALETYKFRDALTAAMGLARFGNKYLADNEPWKLYKQDPESEQVKQIMFDALQVASALSVIFEPFLPFSAQKLQKMLNSDLKWEDLAHSELLAAGHQIGKAELLFQKIEDETIEAQMDKLKKDEPAFDGAPLKEEVDFPTFQKMDIRVATILSAKKVEGADRLLELQVDTGVDQRTVVSGIAEHFKPEDVVGKQVSLLANLAPRKIRGVVSHGMILMAEDADGALKLVSPDVAVANGSVVA